MYSNSTMPPDHKQNMCGVLDVGTCTGRGEKKNFDDFFIV